MIPETSSCSISVPNATAECMMEMDPPAQVVTHRQREQSTLPVTPDLMIHAGREFKPIQSTSFPFLETCLSIHTVSSLELMSPPEKWVLAEKKSYWTRTQRPQHTHSRAGKCYTPLPTFQPLSNGLLFNWGLLLWGTPPILQKCSATYSI